MSETDDERGESYLEIQMDRSTIVLAALGLIVLLAAAFLLGSWFGSRSPEGSAIATAASAASDATADDAEIDAGHDGETVPSEAGFGGKSVSARGAPPLGAVPTPVRGSAVVPGPSGGDLVEESVSAPSSATSARATSPRATAGKPKPSATAPRTTAARATAAPKPAASAPTSGDSWIVQVAAAKDPADAETLSARLRKKGWDVRLMNEGGFVKVQVGPFASKSAAQSAEQRLKREERLSTWLKRA